VTRYRLSPAAERDLEEILDYTVQQWGLGQALRYMEKMESAFEVLAASPDAGLDSGEVRAGYRRLSVGRHVIYFRRTDYGVAVIRILHGQMDPSRRL
jgi:toxin ParE1/3/4